MSDCAVRDCHRPAILEATYLRNGYLLALDVCRTHSRPPIPFPNGSLIHLVRTSALREHPIPDLVPLVPEAHEAPLDLVALARQEIERG